MILSWLLSLQKIASIRDLDILFKHTYLSMHSEIFIILYPRSVYFNFYFYFILFYFSIFFSCFDLCAFFFEML